jgi:hypothetical protein
MFGGIEAALLSVLRLWRRWRGSLSAVVGVLRRASHRRSNANGAYRCAGHGRRGGLNGDACQLE